MFTLNMILAHLPFPRSRGMERATKLEERWDHVTFHHNVPAIMKGEGAHSKSVILQLQVVDLRTRGMIQPRTMNMAK